ncbi:hypothetical protein EFBL_2194 [Effusibacillus lacus]|uniref:Uncharacterized protein n=1 Tax=Effusibacillus lacus TaxID=1348429 RepID=A0A292YHU9_9BACL|nr:hypothetical protein EFBL_2194 [Effusibacillus lacus]
MVGTKSRATVRKARAKGSVRKARAKGSVRKARARGSVRKARARGSVRKARARGSVRKARARDIVRKAKGRGSVRKAKGRGSVRKARARGSVPMWLMPKKPVQSLRRSLTIHVSITGMNVSPRSRNKALKEIKITVNRLGLKPIVITSRAKGTSPDRRNHKLQNSRKAPKQLKLKVR